MQLGSRYNQHSFAQIPTVHMQRSNLDRSSAAKTTFKFDELVPCFVDEILPGDSINLNVKTFARLEAQVVPLMDNMYIDYHFFFVPNRLVWNNWERLMGAQDDPGDSTDFLVPQVTANALDNNVMQLGDQMGIPIQQNVTVNALPFRANNLIVTGKQIGRAHV